MGKRKFVFDMDGVLVEYRRDMSSDNMALMQQKGYFENLRPEWNMILAMKKLKEKFPEDVYILTAIYPTKLPYSVQEKKDYCEKVFPFMRDHLIIVDSEKGETKPEKFFEVTGQHINKNCYLIDDYGVNLKKWKEEGGSEIKYLNLINNNHGTIYERVLDCFMDPETLFETILSF